MLVSKRHAGWSKTVNIALTAITVFSGFALLLSQTFPKESNVRSIVSIVAGVMVLLNEALRQLNTKIFEHDKKAAMLASISEKLNQAFSSQEVALTKVLNGALTEEEIDKASEEIRKTTEKAWAMKPNTMHIRDSESCRDEASRRTEIYFKTNYNFTSSPI